MPENRQSTGFRGPSPDVGKATQFKPGQSGNPGGRPKTAHISQALRAALAAGKADEMADTLVALATGRKKGSSVQLAALREIADRTEGRPHQSVNLDASFSLGDRLEAACKRREAEERNQSSP